MAGENIFTAFFVTLSLFKFIIKDKLILSITLCLCVTLHTCKLCVSDLCALAVFNVHTHNLTSSEISDCSTLARVSNKIKFRDKNERKKKEKKEIVTVKECYHISYFTLFLSIDISLSMPIY